MSISRLVGNPRAQSALPAIHNAPRTSAAARGDASLARSSIPYRVAGLRRRGQDDDIANSNAKPYPSGMARRRLIDEPVSKLAIWARRLSLFSLAAVVLAVLIVHSGFLEVRPALVTFAAALALALTSLLLAFAAFVVIWKDGLKGMGAALSAIAIAAALLAYPSYLAIRSFKLPWIYDITTDPIDPPRYDTLAKVRPRNANPVIYAGLSAAEQQIEAYPDIEPIKSPLDARQVYEVALAIITQRRWRIVEARAPDQGRREGRIEAVARTPLMGFRDDVIVRIRSERQGSRVDIRSSSRYGTFDFGTNAERVRRLIEDIEEELPQRRDEQPEAPPRAESKGRQPSARR
jgi:uncharacterized protein (DUF1499 family)